MSNSKSPDGSTNEEKGPVTDASESPVFKSKHKRRRVILESDDDEEEEKEQHVEVEGGCVAVRSEAGEERSRGDGVGGDDGGGGATGDESEHEAEERMETSATEVDDQKMEGIPEEVCGTKT